jgi:hypothetical protein
VEQKEYKDIVEDIKLDILVEDNCAGIVADEIIVPKLNPKFLQRSMRSIPFICSL